MGKIELKKWGIDERDGNHEAIVDEATFNKVQLQLKKKGTKKKELKLHVSARGPNALTSGVQ